MADKPVAVTTRTGETGYINPELAETARISGAHEATDAELRAAQRQANTEAQAQALRERFEGAGFGPAFEGQIGPEIAGVARGATFGLSDPLLIAGAEAVGGRDAREAMRERLNTYQAYAPARSFASELGGMVGVSALAGGGLGGGVEGITESALGRGVGARILGGAAAGATEGAVYGAGKAASDAALQDAPLTGEKLVAGATHGALFGGVTGGLLAGGGALLRRGGGEFGAPTAGRAMVEDAGAAAPKGSIADTLQKTSDVKTIKALGGSAGDIRKLEDTVPGGFRRVAQDIRGDVEAATGKSIGLHSRESLHEYAVKRVDELGEKLGGMLKKLDDAKTGVAPDAAAFTQKVRQEILAPKMLTTAEGKVVPMPGQEKTVKAVEKWLGSIDEAFAGGKMPTFSEWQKIRVGLDKDIYQGAVKASPKVESLRQMRGLMEGELTEAGEKAAQTMGGSFQAEYQATKSLYQSVQKAAELTERGVSRDLVNNSFGLTSRIAGTVMGAAGMGAAGPAGGLVAGGASALMGKLVQNRGDVLAADLLDRAASLLGARRIASRVEAQMTTGVRGLLGASATTGAGVGAFAPPARAAAAPLGIKLTGDKRSDYQKVATQVTTAQANPAATADRVGRSLGDLAEHAPKTAAAAVQTTLAGLSFLSSKLPPSRQDPYSLQPQLQPRTRASDAEISQFMRYAQAVDDPLIVLREAKTGTLTRDHVEAVKAVYPKLYDQMRTEVMQHLIDSKSPLPYGKRIQLGILLDIPTDKTLSPDFLTAIQATYTSAEKAGAESPPPTLSRPIEVAGSQQTAMQQAVERAQ